MTPQQEQQPFLPQCIAVKESSPPVRKQMITTANKGVLVLKTNPHLNTNKSTDAIIEGPVVSAAGIFYHTG